MTLVRRTLEAAALLLALALPASAQERAAGSVMTLDFAGTSCLHRWSQNGQNEFTPAAQPDLDKWQDMLTIDVHDDATNAEQLANVANNVLAP